MLLKAFESKSGVFIVATDRATYSEADEKNELAAYEMTLTAGK